MIFNIRGTNGSGKSTVVHDLLKKFPHEVLNPSAKGKPEGYKVRVEGLRKPLFVVGPYSTACGGCDALKSYYDIWPTVERYAKLGHVLFEGILISGSVGVVGEAMVKVKRQCVIAYLDTPIEVCLARIAKRRAKRGVTTVMNPMHTTNKHRNIAKTQAKFEAFGIRCVVLEHKQASKQMLEVILENCEG